MTIKILSMLVLSMLFSGLSSAYENTHECISSDGSSILFENRPSDVPVRMYITDKCFYGKPTEHHITLNIELKNTYDDGLLFDGYAVFGYYFDSRNDITQSVDRILKEGILEESGNRYAQYKIVGPGKLNKAYILVDGKYNAVFECIGTFCDFRSFVGKDSIIYFFRGRFPEGFDPAVAEDVIKGFVRQVFNM
jgi:hypothetical protein